MFRYSDLTENFKESDLYITMIDDQEEDINSKIYEEILKICQLDRYINYYKNQDNYKDCYNINQAILEWFYEDYTYYYNNSVF